MHFLLVIFWAIAIAIGFWLDNEITSPALQFWWGSIVVSYLIVCLRSPVVNLTKGKRIVIAGVVATTILACIFVFDDLLTLYLSGIVLLLTLLIVNYISSIQYISSAILLAIMISLGLAILPIAMNRIVLSLPNLSGGANFSLHESEYKKSKLEMSYSNRGNVHTELQINFGTQIYIQDSQNLPLLKIEILRQDIVIRLLSIRYDVRVGFIKLPLLAYHEDELMQLNARGGLHTPRLEMDRGMLLIDQLEVGTPAWFQLPPLEGIKLSSADHIKVVVVRILFWLLVCGGLLLWRPNFLMKTKV